MSDLSKGRQSTVLVRAAAFEALLASGQESFSEADLDAALSWLADPARSETLIELRRTGWLEVGPAGEWTLTDPGREVYGALRRAALDPSGQGLPAGLTADQIVRVLLSHGLEELAAAGRQALVPVLSGIPLLTTRAVVQAAESHALRGQPESAFRMNR